MEDFSKCIQMRNKYESLGRTETTKIGVNPNRLERPNRANLSIRPVLKEP